ncbi:MarR family winged helix-turn-helix transcriptional regulator [Nocardioides humilatus]|uniref:MarR family winged helix-turn-helix transcriptional regulator n=1 Tax=Nocardioides humilatus TaxID=2607660 RepID=UPI001CB70662|nr:MarR family transcriptional regulator [Nocardioides humilatus]
MEDQDRDTSIESVQRTLALLMRTSGARATFARQAAVGGVDLKQPAYVLLRTLVESGPVPTGELARRAHMDVGMATRQVSALVDDGLATRTPAPDDGRVTLVAPTAEGRDAASALMAVRSRHLRAALSDWSEDDLQTLDRLLSQFLTDTFSTPFEPE